MKVLLLVPFYYPTPNAAAVRAIAFAKYFSREGAEVEVMTSQTSDVPTPSSHNGVPITVVDSYEKIRFSHDPISSLTWIPRVIRELRKRITMSNPDVIMTSTPSPFLAFEGNLACKKLKIPIVFDVRDTWLLSSLTHKGRFNNYLKRRIEGQCCWGAKKVLIAAPFLRDHLIWDHSLPNDRIVDALNGADLEEFDIKITPSYDIVYLGQPSILYDLERVFQAYAYLVKQRPSTTIRHIGWVDTDYAHHLEKVVSDLGLADNIQFMPKLPHNDIPRILASARIGVASQAVKDILKVSIPMKIYEYFAAGLPIALLGSPADCEMRRLWQTTQAGVYESDPKRLADRLTEMLTDEKMRASYVDMARKASLRYDRKTVARKVYYEVLIPLVEKRKAAAQ